MYMYYTIIHVTDMYKCSNQSVSVMLACMRYHYAELHCRKQEDIDQSVVNSNACDDSDTHERILGIITTIKEWMTFIHYLEVNTYDL